MARNIELHPIAGVKKFGEVVFDLNEARKLSIEAQRECRPSVTESFKHEFGKLSSVPIIGYSVNWLAREVWLTNYRLGSFGYYYENARSRRK